GLHNVLVLLGLVQEGSLKLLQGRNEVLDGGLGGGDVGGGREGVVGGLAHVDVVVRVNLDARLLSQGRDDLVGVHVRGGAGAGLEDVDRELGVELVIGDAQGGVDDGLALLLRDRKSTRLNSSHVS